MALSTAQLTVVAAKAGWTGSDLAVAIAVALAESGGNPNARNAGSSWDSRGLWQINIAKNAHPEYASQNMYDPQANANAAHAIWAKDGWGPWQAHNNGKYLLYMPLATAAAGSIGVGASAEPAVMGSVDAILQIAQEPIRLMKWLAEPGTQTRIAKVVVGGGLVMLGLYIVARPVVEPAVKAGARVAELGAMA